MFRGLGCKGLGCKSLGSKGLGFTGSTRGMKQGPERITRYGST